MANLDTLIIALLRENGFEECLGQADLMEMDVDIEASRYGTALYEELIAMVNRYHRARPQTPVSEIVYIVYEVWCAAHAKSGLEVVTKLPPTGTRRKKRQRGERGQEM